MKEIILFDRTGLKHLKTIVVHDVKLKTPISVFMNEQYERLFEVKGHHEQQVCESIFMIQHSSFESGKRKGRNEIRKGFKDLVEIEDEY